MQLPLASSSSSSPSYEYSVFGTIIPHHHICKVNRSRERERGSGRSSTRTSLTVSEWTNVLESRRMMIIFVLRRLLRLIFFQSGWKGKKFASNRNRRTVKIKLRKENAMRKKKPRRCESEARKKLEEKKRDGNRRGYADTRREKWGLFAHLIRDSHYQKTERTTPAINSLFQRYPSLRSEPLGKRGKSRG